MIKVSVTIPVYNAAEFLPQAVQSALDQPQTAEVILVEDLSTDSSWQICQSLAAQDPRIHLYRHPDGKNHGCSASRSLAVQKSSCEYVSFLDADDFFLPNRFDKAEQMFSNDPELEGVYEAIGMHVENEAALQRWLAAKRSSSVLHTMSRYVSPEDLFSVLVKGDAGSFVIDGLVVKRSVFEKVGFFDQTLRLHMDEVFFIKLAAKAKLAPGRLEEPVACWRVHNHNRISAQRSNNLIYEMRLKFWNTLWKWSKAQLKKEDQELILEQMIIDARYRSRLNRKFPKKFSFVQQRLQLALLPLAYPQMLLEPLFWKSFAPSIDYWLGKSSEARPKERIAP